MQKLFAGTNEIRFKCSRKRMAGEAAADRLGQTWTRLLDEFLLLKSLTNVNLLSNDMALRNFRRGNPYL
jgi:hypothetical protein